MDEAKFFQKITRSRVFVALELFFSITVGLLIVFPILATLYILNEVLRLIITVGLWIVYGDKLELSDDPVGNNYNVLGRKSPRHTVLYLGKVDGALDVESVRENYQKRLISNKVYRKLRYIYVQKWGYICLKKCENFDIKNHIRYYPGTEDRVVGEDELMQTILPDLSEPMEISKPQWEEVIIPHYKKSVDSDKSQALRIIRMHHSYMDGACTLLMIANTFCDEGADFPFVIDPCKPLNISTVSMILYKLASLAYFTSSMVQNMVSPPYFRSRTSRFNINRGKNGRCVFGATEKIPIELFQKIKDRSGVSMSAIVSTVLGGAIRDMEVKYAEKWYKSPRIPSSQQLWLVCGMFPYQRDRVCNNHLAMETHLNMAKLTGSERLLQNHEELGRLAKNPLVNVYFWYVKLMGRAPSFVADICLYLGSAPILLSNIPLCTRPIQLWGKNCTTMMGWVPLIARTGLGIVSVRYADHFCYCVQADSNVLNEEEMQYFLRRLEKQVEELCHETSRLERKISTETSAFRHGNKETPRRRLLGRSQSSDKNEALISYSETEEQQSLENPQERTDCYNNNTINTFNDGSAKKSNYSFFYKLKDSLEHIKDGIRKIKEQ